MYYLFRMHMEYHKADKFLCDCKIMFENRKEKVHHMHEQHLKVLSLHITY